jgi:hypothetical protein
MKFSAVLFSLLCSATGVSAQTYSVSTLFTFPGVNTGPLGVAVDSRGNIYASGNFLTYPNAPGIAQIFAPASNGANGSATVFAGGTLNGFQDGTGPAAEFSTPEGLSTDSSGNIYLADVLANESATIRKIAPPGGTVTTLSGLSGNTQQYDNATGVAIGASGNIYVSAVGGNSGPLAQYVLGGSPSLISVGTIVDMQDGGQAVAGNACYGVAVDSSNSLYVTIVAAGPYSAPTFGPTQLYVLKISGSTVTQLFALPQGTNPQLEPYSDNLGALDGTVPIAVDGTGKIYVGWFGNLYLYDGGSGPTQIASIGGPIVGLSTDSSGRIYVASGPPGYPAAGIGAGQISVVAPPGVAPLPSAPTPTPTPTPVSNSNIKLINISARCYVGTGGNVAIAGFVVSGSASADRFLIRAVGPTLSQFSVSGVLAQPVLTLYNSSGTQIATNTGWGTNSNASEISAAFAATGAFILPSGSADSALLLNLAPGSYTAQVSGLNNTTGTALAEVYEVPTPTPTP